MIPAMIRRFHEAKTKDLSQVSIWGTGTPLREFLHADDMADACVFLLENYSDFEHVNVGSQQEMTIMEIARLIARVVGYEGQILTDPSRPDGTPRKLMDSGKLFAMAGSRASVWKKDYVPHMRIFANSILHKGHHAENTAG